MFRDTYTQRHETSLRHFPANYFINKDPPYVRCVVLSFYRNISSTTRYFSGKMAYLVLLPLIFVS